MLAEERKTALPSDRGSVSIDARTAVRQLESVLLSSTDVDDHGRTRTKARAPTLDVTGCVSTCEPSEGGEGKQLITGAAGGYQ